MKDEILEELWKAKDQIAAETKGSAKALFERLRALEQKSSHPVVNHTGAAKAQHT